MLLQVLLVHRFRGKISWGINGLSDCNGIGAKARALARFLLRQFVAVNSLHHVLPPRAFSALSRPELEALLVELFTEVATLKQTVAEQREEIARLKGLKGRPNIKPSGMDKGSTPVTPTQNEKRPGRGKVTPRVSVEETVINAEIPPGCRFKGHQSFLVQDW